MQLVVDSKKCPQNHKCPSVKICPVDALSQCGNNAPMVNNGKCVVCEECVRFCPMGALSLGNK